MGKSPVRRKKKNIPIAGKEGRALESGESGGIARIAHPDKIATSLKTGLLGSRKEQQR